MTAIRIVFLSLLLLPGLGLWGCSDTSFESSAPARESHSSEADAKGSRGGADGGAGNGEDGANGSDSDADRAGGELGQGGDSGVAGGSINGDGDVGNNGAGGLDFGSGESRASIGEPIDEPDVVRNLSASLTWDGAAQFCVDFSTGQITLDYVANRLGRTSATATFTITTNAGDQTDEEAKEFNTAQPNTQKVLPGDWSFVKAANLQITNLTPTNRDPTRYTQSNPTPTQNCVSVDDSDRDQSGSATLQFDFNLTTN